MSRRQRGGVLALVCAVAIHGTTPMAHAQVSKGHQILINRGLQVQGMVANYDVFHLNTYSNANYTSINWLWDSTPSQMGAAPGFPWARWVNAETNVPPQGSEGPYMSQLVTLQLGDEWNLNDDATRTRLVNWFIAVRTNFPNTILHHNSYGGQVGDAQLGDFITRARPDMLCFDTYPWRSVWDSAVSNHIGAPIPGPPTSWYGDLRRYREHARGANIPLGIYVQTFHAVQDYDQTVYRDPSPSELRLNHFAALAFNAKALIDFTYNTGASSLFTTPGGDSNPTPLLATKTDAALRARNFGKALVRLKPIADATSQYTTSIMFIRGRNSAGTLNPVPNSFIADPQDPTTTEWATNRNDPYLRSWSVTNKAGIKNNGQPGHVILSWFKPLDESFDGPSYTNEVYLMVVNALTDPAGAAADCLQEIKLNFDFTNALTSVETLDSATGQLQTNTLPVLSNTVRQLILNLNGGDAALFKFSDGAPFVGISAVDTNPPGTLIGTAASWRYWDSNSPPPANWAATNFNDSAWPAGPAQLGFGDGDEATVIKTNRTRITTYFRRAFNVVEPLLWTGLILDLLRDDGAVVYLNGAEVFRSNMPPGPIDANTQAASLALTADESTNFYPTNLDAAVLRRGTNVVAVEVHQFGTNSSDLSFALRLVGTNPAPTALVAAGSNWRYLDTGVAPAGSWTNVGFNDAAWLSGPAQLGYGDNDEATVVSYGTNANNKYITTWFRQRFAVADPAGIRYLTLRVLRDDGAVVFLNGAEIFRSNMPTGAITSATLALTAIAGADESTWLTAAVSLALLVAGTNIIAAEIHQNTNTSSDISFDLELIGYPTSSLPRLSVASQNNGVALNWPGWATGYQLVATTNLAAPMSWSPVTNATQSSNGAFSLTLALTNLGKRFFRLGAP
jgi:hypothetical protein